MEQIEVKVINLSLSHLGFVVMLGSESYKKTLPIFIGAPEAQAIAVVLNGVESPRPMTHDLSANVVRSLGCSISKVLICSLIDNTFYAKIFFEFLETPSNNFDMDARPSDAIALGLRFGAPIFVVQSVMEEAGIAPEEDKLPKEDAEKKELSPLEILQQDLLKSIQEERYEDAAEIRDKIAKIKKKIEPN